MMTPTSAARGPVDYLSITLFSLITVTAVLGVPAYGYVYRYAPIDWMMFGALYVITGLGITVGYHRLISHRSFACRNWVKAGLLIAGAWALQNSALKWAADHRRHHAQCDGDEDPYNAQRGFWYSHCGWIFFTRPPHLNEKYQGPLREDPLIVWQHRYYVPLVLSGLALPVLAGFVVNGASGALSCFLLAGVGRLFCVLNSTFCINSICHLWGSQSHGQADSSRNSWWVSFLTFGEGYHNYHHTYQSDYRNGACWYNFDPSKWLIFSLSRLGLASALRRSAAREN